MNKDYYKTLNINRNSSQDKIKKSFRSLSKKHHPDKGGDEAIFKELSEAYDTLSDENKRREYDTRGQNPFHNSQHQRGGPNMDDIFKSAAAAKFKSLIRKKGTVPACHRCGYLKLK